MSKLYIKGGNKLEGEIKIHGAKNSALPLLAATLLCKGECVLRNCPNLSDTAAAVNILKYLGCKCSRTNHTVTVNAQCVAKNDIPDFLMRQMRSSIVFLGAIVGRMGSANISSPGGCELGPRPIDLHLSALKKMGLNICEDHGYLNCTAPNGMRGAEIFLHFPSVGATENIILAAVLAKGKTVIHNPAREPEITDLADFLNKAGAMIFGAGSDKIIIEGVNRLKPVEHSVIPDRIEAATYLAAAAVTNGRVDISGVIPSQLDSTLDIFRQCGYSPIVKKESISLRSDNRPQSIPIIKTLVYPGFPTDAGPPILTLLGLARGTTVFVENIFENRFRYIDELRRLGAKIRIHSNAAVIEGVPNYSAANTGATDLRGGAALVLASLSAQGNSVIDNIHYIDRGYECIEKHLSEIGADIKRK